MFKLTTNITKNSLFAICYLIIIFNIILSPIFYSYDIQTSIFISDSNIENYNYNINNFTKEDIDLARLNLINFYSKNQELNSKYFTEKEIIHYHDVKEILFKFHLLGLISLTILFGLKSFYKTTIVIIYSKFILFISSIFILSNFQYFWDYIFHPLLFNNNYWMIYSYEISFYLFSNYSFSKLITYVILIIILFNIINYILIKKLFKSNNK